jgi:3-deoxy-manno-octulosonate cytidylyltransferase (CMP-KDO synthetase)
VPPRILGVIPARFASSRFPGKALATIAGKSMLQHVYERASQARYLRKVIIDPDAIDAAALGLLDADEVPMGTLKARISDPAEIANPHVVKVVTDRAGNAIYFSRCPIPFARDTAAGIWFKHIGLYIYRRDFLLNYSQLPVGPLEQAERLEQLRALENGYAIRVVETEYEAHGVDTPEDLERVSQLFEATEHHG